MIGNGTFCKNESVNAEYLNDKVERKILSFSENMMIVEVVFETGGIGELHTHSHEQMVYIKSGKFEFTLLNQKYIVTEGDTLAFKPNEQHGVKCIEKGALIDMFTPYREDFLEHEVV